MLTSVPGMVSGTRVAMLERIEPMLLVAAERGQPTLVAATVAAPSVDAIDVYGAAMPHASLWLRADAGLALVGVGAAWSVSGNGPSRFRDVSGSWRALLGTALVDEGGAPRGTGPRLMGGFGFLDEPPVSAAWASFDPASFVLPSLLMTQTDEGAWLTMSLVIHDGPAARRMALRLLESWEALVTRGGAPSHEAGLDSLRVVAQRPEAPQWRDSVARLGGAVGRGRLDKAVLSRRVVLQGAAGLDVPAALHRLRESAPESTIFALTRGSATFLGATPEDLVSVRGRELRTMAMAGSTRRSGNLAVDDELAARLLHSDKEREEHAVVVTMLREALEPVVDDLQMPAHPVVRRYRHVQHLVTPVRGLLRGDADVLTFVERLHPTPAVGGAPRDLALELIAEEEPDERGWYSGPLGWLDGHGDGEFVVALRSGLVDGDTATLFAGCGIVADSDPQREWEESATKLLALGSALGRIEA